MSSYIREIRAKTLKKKKKIRRPSKYIQKKNDATGGGLVVGDSTREKPRVLYRHIALFFYVPARIYYRVDGKKRVWSGGGDDSYVNHYCFARNCARARTTGGDGLPGEQ